MRIARTDADAEMTQGVAVPDESIDAVETISADVDSDPGTAHVPAHDADWFTGIVREHATALVRYFARRGPRQDADDLAAEVFATAWRRRADVPD
ncbi:MAG: hypothetical protein J0I18_10870, partial [Actinobacteria bacterium]|nr:hypothetical protein [Actinomycetota bacterium]